MAYLAEVTEVDIDGRTKKVRPSALGYWNQ